MTRDSLALSVAEISDLRRRMLRSAIEAFRPGLLLVDNVPRGPWASSRPALEAQRAGGRRCVVGLRDVLDDQAVVAEEGDGPATIRDFYEAVWVYGDPHVYTRSSHRSPASRASGSRARPPSRWVGRRGGPDVKPRPA
jgi:predicted glycosyltransferase